MQVGTPLQAPEGYLNLERGITYYLLRNSRVRSRVLLVYFTTPPNMVAILVLLDRHEFEGGLVRNLIMATPASGMPPHLEDFKGFNFEHVDSKRTNAKRTLRSYVEHRLNTITPLLERESEILDAACPEREINRYCVTHGYNSQRVRTWFFLYVCFGRNIWTLLPGFHRNGRWDRMTVGNGVKLGRPNNVRGRHAGCRMNAEISALVVASFRRYAQVGKTLADVYAEAMCYAFRAKVDKDEKGVKRLIPTVTPIPTYHQYRYCLYKEHGMHRVQRDLYGAERARRRYAEHEGAFTANVANLYEVVEADAYYCEDLPRGYVDGDAVRPIVVTRCVDTVSGLRLGIGFSYGKESSDGYNAMLFCAAISKVKFCSLFGIEISETDWPSIGLPARYITDRGPGIKREPGASDAANSIPIRELTPSGQGQSKALVESAQRRRRSLEGPATRVLSELTAYQIVQREIHRLLMENSSADSRKRLTPEMIRAGVVPTPLGLWKYLDARARNVAESVPFEDAVRRFLKRERVRVARDGVHFRTQRYDSDALRSTGLPAQVALRGTLHVDAYVFPFSIRYIWVEVEGQLVEVEAKLAIRDDDSQLNRTLLDLESEAQSVRAFESVKRENRTAAQVESMLKLEQQTEQRWYSTKRVSARSVKKSISQDAIEARHAFEGGGYE